MGYYLSVAAAGPSTLISEFERGTIVGDSKKNRDSQASTSTGSPRDFSLFCVQQILPEVDLTLAPAVACQHTIPAQDLTG